ncbi:MAG: PEP-CTERM sorting domain-containing protein [Deltaproteobacteria bacterium]|nr:PEP-CTERM sorting domain-containing protein [Deltaproteobacteria bacterium]MBW2421866.1 PEP-CTERM sorting domain-containing protein [Deltaproteobacteria bacterium]
MRHHTLQAALIGALVCIGGSPGHATTVSVFQESAPGAGDFGANPLGTIQSFSTTGTLAVFYSYASQQFTNTGSIALTPDQSHMFLVDASDGLGLFVVHDDGITRGGNAETKVDLFGGDTATFLVQDDPGEASYTDSGTGFTAKQSWTQGFTDGYVIGSLDGIWTADVQFTDVFAAGPTINGLATWAALSSDGLGGQTEIALALVEDRRVRLVVVPEPSTLWLVGSGLLGLVATARRKGSA